jgi:hypothetical protein
MIIHESSYNTRLEITNTVSINNELDDVKNATGEVS